MANSTQTHEALITLTSDLVAAHLSNNSVGIEQVPNLIHEVFAALSSLGAEPAVVQGALEPAVSIRATVKPDHVVCLECGRKLKTLKRHIGAEHGLSAEAYRQRWNLPADHPLVAPNYAMARSALSKSLGLGRRPKEDGAGIVNVTPEETESKPAPKRTRKLSLRFKDAAG